MSGRLKVAPEHTSESVLKMMRKPSFSLFYKFKEIFERESDLAGKKQQLIPYFISSHPGCTEKDMAELALETKQLGFRLEQVQDFTPTPMTLSTELYYAECYPGSGTPIYVAKKPEQKRNQQRFFFWYLPENRPWIRDTLERLKMGKVSRFLLSRSAKEEGREYRPSEDEPEPPKKQRYEQPYAGAPRVKPPRGQRGPRQNIVANTTTSNEENIRDKKNVSNEPLPREARFKNGLKEGVIPRDKKNTVESERNVREGTRSTGKPNPNKKPRWRDQR